MVNENIQDGPFRINLWRKRESKSEDIYKAFYKTVETEDSLDRIAEFRLEKDIIDEIVKVENIRSFELCMGLKNLETHEIFAPVLRVRSADTTQDILIDNLRTVKELRDEMYEEINSMDQKIFGHIHTVVLRIKARLIKELGADQIDSILMIIREEIEEYFKMIEKEAAPILVSRFFRRVVCLLLYLLPNSDICKYLYLGRIIGQGKFLRSFCANPEKANKNLFNLLKRAGEFEQISISFGVIPQKVSDGDSIPISLVFRFVPKNPSDWNSYSSYPGIEISNNLDSTNLLTDDGKNMEYIHPCPSTCN
jgi:hypothetical protein